MEAASWKQPQTSMGQLPMQPPAKLASRAEHMRLLAVKLGPQMGDRFQHQGWQYPWSAGHVSGHTHLTVRSGSCVMRPAWHR